MASGSPLKKFMPENTAGMKILEQVFGSDFLGFTLIYLDNREVEKWIYQFTMNLPGKSVKKNLNKPERRQFRKEVALAADIFMRLTLLKFLSMMCAVAKEYLYKGSTPFNCPHLPLLIIRYLIFFVKNNRRICVKCNFL